jgi:hypothetical protein
MEEIQKNARTIHRLLVVVCVLLIGVGLDRPKRQPQAAVDYLVALREIDWQSHRKALRASIRESVASFRAEDELPDELEVAVANLLSKELPRIGPVHVFRPRRLGGYEWETLGHIADTGSISEIREFVRRNQGAARLDHSESQLLSPTLIAALVGAFGSIAWEKGIDVRYQLEPESIRRIESSTWSASAIVTATLRDVPPNSGETPQLRTEHELELLADNEFLPAPKLNTLAAQPVPGEVLRIWSKVENKTSHEALRILREESAPNYKFSLFGVPIPGSLLTTVGPLVCAALLIYLLANLSWIKSSWPPDEVHWAPLDRRNGRIAFCATVISISTLPLTAQAAIAWRVYSTDTWTFRSLTNPVLFVLLSGAVCYCAYACAKSLWTVKDVPTRAHPPRPALSGEPDRPARLS